ncbi:hypothetical protein QQF64_012017 [Cirrhinus molitorella]|uniref:Uncharacterized protein n=1 Tax=Cirrhinus molitorella TaxID=172907 RepID=A0ABR3LU90_9TELE
MDEDSCVDIDDVEESDMQIGDESDEDLVDGIEDKEVHEKTAASVEDLPDLGEQCSEIKYSLPNAPKIIRQHKIPALDPVKQNSPKLHPRGHSTPDCHYDDMEGTLEGTVSKKIYKDHGTGEVIVRTLCYKSIEKKYSLPNVPKIARQDNTPALGPGNRNSPKLHPKGHNTADFHRKTTLQVHLKGHSGADLHPKDHNTPDLYRKGNSSPELYPSDDSSSDLYPKGHSSPELDPRGHSSQKLHPSQQYSINKSSNRHIITKSCALRHVSPEIRSLSHASNVIHTSSNTITEIGRPSHASSEIRRSSHAAPSVFPSKHTEPHQNREQTFSLQTSLLRNILAKQEMMMDQLWIIFKTLQSMKSTEESETDLVQNLLPLKDVSSLQDMKEQLQ